MRASFSLGRIGGINIGIHYTWIFAFILISWTISALLFPTLFPDWDTLTYWITGVVAALLLFVSVLIHELAHSFLARARGLPVEGITLFIFGGVSNLRGEAKNAWDEFIIAVVGPITSFVLAGAFWAIGVLIDMPGTPVGAVLFYLAIVNALLGGFNLLPGFPLDGGRVLRSILWGSTGSLVRATNIAALVGQVFGWLLIGWGVFQILQGNLFGGLWIAFIGWFLNSAADASRKEVGLREIFTDVLVRDVMETDPESIGPDTTVDHIVRELFLRRGIRAMPICHNGNLIGIVTLTDVKEVPSDRWASTSVERIMTRDPLHKVSPSDDLARALNLMTEHNIHQVLVTDDGRLVGMLNRAHVIRYMQGLEELGVSSAALTGNARRTRPQRAYTGTG